MTHINHQFRKHNLLALSQQGFTLIELMVSITILTILIAIAAPSFSEIILGGKLRSTANDFTASVYLARGEAIKRNAVVNLCASSDGTTCTGEWEQGWIVLAPDSGSGTVIQRQQALSPGLKMTDSGGISTISFQPTGVGATSAELTVCRATPAGGQERVISISATGRPMVTKTTTGSCP